MAKVRNIKPQFFSDEKVGRVSPLARYLFLGAFTLADDNGVLRGAPAYIKSQLFCYDEDISPANISKWLTELQHQGLIIPLTYHGEQYFVIRSFSKHQTIDKRYRSETIPAGIVAECIGEWEGRNHPLGNKAPELPQIPQKITDSITCSETIKESKIEARTAQKPPIKKKPSPPPEDYIDDAFKKPFELWVKYKAERQQTYKPTGKIACYKKLVRLSNGDPAHAMAIVENCMSNNYAGLFPLPIENTRANPVAHPYPYELLTYDEMCRHVQKNGTTTGEYASIRIVGKEKPMWIRRIDKERFRVPDTLDLNKEAPGG